MMEQNDSQPMFRTISSTPAMRISLVLPNERVMTDEADEFIKNADMQLRESEASFNEAYRPVFRKYCANKCRIANNMTESSEDMAAPVECDLHSQLEESFSEPHKANVLRGQRSPNQQSIKWEFGADKQRSLVAEAVKQCDANKAEDTVEQVRSPSIIHEFERESVCKAPCTQVRSELIDATQFEQQQLKINQLINKIDELDQKLSVQASSSASEELEVKAPDAISTRAQELQPLQMYDRLQNEMSMQEATFETLMDHEKMELEQNDILARQITELSEYLRDTAAPPHIPEATRNAEVSVQSDEFLGDCCVNKEVKTAIAVSQATDERETGQKHVQAENTMVYDAKQSGPKILSRKAHAKPITKIPQLNATAEREAESLQESTLKYEPYRYTRLKDPYTEKEQARKQTPKSPTKCIEKHDYVGDALDNFDQVLQNYANTKQIVAYDEEVEQLKEKQKRLDQKIRGFE